MVWWHGAKDQTRPSHTNGIGPTTARVTPVTRRSVTTKERARRVETTVAAMGATATAMDPKATATATITAAVVVMATATTAGAMEVVTAAALLRGVKASLALLLPQLL